MHAVSRRGVIYTSRLPAQFKAGRRRACPAHLLRSLLHTSSSRRISWPWEGVDKADTGSANITPASKPSNHNTPTSTSISKKDEPHDRKGDTKRPPLPAEIANVIAGEPAASDDGAQVQQIFQITPELEQQFAGGPPHDSGNGNGHGDKEKNGNNGSGGRRGSRNRRPREIPPIRLPLWFLAKNVRLHRYDASLVPGTLLETSGPSSTIEEAPSRKDTATPANSVDGEAVGAELKDSLAPAIDAVRHLADVQRRQGSEEETASAVQSLKEKINTLSQTVRQSRASKLGHDALSEVSKEYPQFEKEIREFEESESHAAEELQATRKNSWLNEDDDPSYAPVYRIHTVQRSEIEASLKAGLILPHDAVSDSFPNPRSNVKLLCPIDGGQYFLDKVVENISSDIGADVVKVDAQDIAEIAGDYVKEGPDAVANSLWTLGYDAGLALNRGEAQEMADVDDAEAEDMEEEDFTRPTGKGGPKQNGKFSAFALPIMSIGSISLGDLTNKKLFQGGQFQGMGQSGKHNGRGNGNGSQNGTGGFSSRQWNDLKLSALLDTLLDATNVKDTREILTAQFLLGRIQEKLDAESGDASTQKYQILYHGHGSHMPAALEGSAFEQQDNSENKTIVLISGFNELCGTMLGQKVVDKLIDVVQKRRAGGQRIMLVGTSASAELVENLSGTDALRAAQDPGPDSVFRPLVVTPEAVGPSGGLYFNDERRRIREINIRHLNSMIGRLQPDLTGDDWMSSIGAFSESLESSAQNTQVASHLEDQVLTLDEVHRIVFTTIGRLKEIDKADPRSPRVTGQEIVSTMKLLDESDVLKTKWVEDEQQLQRPAKESSESSKLSATETRLKRLKKSCNRYEKALLKGVVDPLNIKVAFDDVHAAPETIEALKTLTTLSLTRPEAFKYGVLAKDKISGLLLYGPPGTGKTMLAKAVAKESGATVLEVSGSDVYDMYVGEGEKNVRAVFSLAKKLQPCVVFIDEADAIFASRGSGTNRNSHRELINQFLREWDGMNETTAFIMVATNRPFDLDDAALRRLPRRLLVDLPNEKDREAILGIHLKEEQLEEAVSLSKLAGQTPLYSGSDLKNLAVAAALAAVREENDTAARHEGKEPHRYPERRTLRQAHFDKALEEISASINEDMSSLGAIKKFDEKYGDRRGRRKKTGYGFASGAGLKEEETPKVRG